MKPQSSENNFFETKPFPVVAIGGSAGALEALQSLLNHLNNKTGMAFFYIAHLDPDRESNLVSILARETEMQVTEAQDGLKIAINHLYIIPPNKQMSLVDGEIKLVPRPSRSYTSFPINHFFSSLAEQYKEKSIGIILSGTASDGTLGAKSIKLSGGITFAQDESAKFQSMPNSAAAEGAIDLVLSPQEIADELFKLSHHKEIYYTALKELDEDSINNLDEELLDVIRLMHRSTGVDFNQYKMNTIKRRIIRRMMLYKITSLHEYSQYIKSHAGEINILYQDLLINVTSFYRDPESIRYFRESLLPGILKAKKNNASIRVWVAACSSGQEAYTLAMEIVEALDEKNLNLTVQVFASDLSEAMINKARLGVYSTSEVAEVPPEIFKKYFSNIDGSYRISKRIRDLCVFATHNIAKDPPFSRIDLMSCCNLLIYLNNHLQKKLMATFHYALSNHGYLMLGKSETIGTATSLFVQVDKKLKVYAKKKEPSSRASFDMTYNALDRDTLFPEAGRQAPKHRTAELELETIVDQLLLKKFTPASVIINSEMDILQFRGSTGLFLEPAPGRASLNLLKMARPELVFELRNIVQKAKRSGAPANKAGLAMVVENKTYQVSIEATPVKANTEEDFYLVVFEGILVTPPEQASTVKDKRVRQLEGELATLRDDMRSVIESQEASNEELQSANEEIISSNEELQTINEELETSKEEIESSNEELMTINEELQVRNDQLLEMQEYSDAIFGTIRESLLILDRDLYVKTANRSFYKTFRVNEADTIGVYFYELGNKQWNIPALRQLLEEVIPQTSEFFDFQVNLSFPGIGNKTMVLNARKLVQKSNRQHLILLAIEDKTGDSSPVE